MIRVLVVDDQSVVCEGLRVMLDAAANISVVDVAHDGQEAVDKVPSTTPDLVLMDLKMPGMNGIHATRLIREKYPAVRVLELTTYDDEWVFDAIRAGASGYLLKDSLREDIIAAIKGTVAGETHVDPSVVTKLFTLVRTGAAPKTSVDQVLSDRELEIVRLLALGLNNAAIAQRLFLAEGTVRNHVSSILSKLKVADRTQAAALAWRSGLISPGDALDD
jgi:NarL family two-component system response regulator LiaR